MNKKEQTNMIDSDAIKSFLITANRNGYGNPNVKPVDELDGSHTIVHENGDWKCHDNYFGGEPFGGRQVIFYKNQPVWMMVYYGLVEDASLQQEVYGFLKQALLNFTDDKPYRGPETFETDGWQYTNNVQGDFDNFTGEEVIYHNGQEVYRTKYQGGVVDKKEAE